MGDSGIWAWQLDDLVKMRSNHNTTYNVSTGEWTWSRVPLSIQEKHKKSSDNRHDICRKRDCSNKIRQLEIKVSKLESTIDNILENIDSIIDSKIKTYCSERETNSSDSEDKLYQEWLYR